MILTIVGEPHHVYAAPALTPYLLAYIMQKTKIDTVVPGTCLSGPPLNTAPVPQHLYKS
jgi:hypothetical protein